MIEKDFFAVIDYISKFDTLENQKEINKSLTGRPKVALGCSTQY